MPGMLVLGVTQMATENERVPLSTGVSQPPTSMGGFLPGMCPECGEPVKMHLKGIQQMQ
jgi:hypothetical protein